MEDYEAYFAHAKMLTKIYALPKPLKVTAEVRKQPLQVSNVNVEADLLVTCVRSSLEQVSSPDTPHRRARPLVILEDYSSSPRHCGSPASRSCRSPFVGSPVKAKRFRSTMRRL